MRVLVFKILALFGSTLCALLLFEAFLRIYNPLGQRIYGDQIVLPKNLHRTIKNDGGSPKLDDLIQFSTNSIGFRGPEPPRDFDRTLTVLAVGGSTTECLFLSQGRSWPEMAGQFLEPAFAPFWMNNAGLDGHSTYGHLFLLDQIVGPMRPKVALFLIGINDVGRERATGREMATPGSKAPLSIRLARHSAMIAAAINLRRQGEARERNLGHAQIDIPSLPKIGPDPDLAASLLPAHREQYVPAYKERVEAIVRTSREHGIEPVLMTQPALYGGAIDPLTLVNLDAIVISDERRIKAGKVRGALAWRILELYNDAVRDVGRTENVLVIDTAAQLPKSSQFFYDFIHFTNDGASEVARIVAQDLCPFLGERFPDFVAGPCPELEPIAFGGSRVLTDMLTRVDGFLDFGNEPRSPYALVGSGWLRPESEAGVDFRRSRGRRSWLNIPLLEVRDYDFVFRARAELLDAPVTAQVDVNGQTVGTMALSHEWTEHAFEVPAESVVVGLNTLALVYSDTPRTLDPGFHGRNASIALDWIRFEPRSDR